MEFNGQYLTYEEYRALGGTLDLMPFNLLEFEARKQIDLRTFNRLVNIQVPQEVKICEFNLINSVKNYANSMSTINGNVASESTDGYSISYVTANQISDIVKSKSTELNDIIRTYLSECKLEDGTPYLYRGV